MYVYVYVYLYVSILCVYISISYLLCICILFSMYVMCIVYISMYMHLIILVDPHPTTMLCRWRMPPVRWWFLAPGQDARASAGPLSAVDWRGLALLALLGPDWGVGGPLGLRAQGPVRPGVVGCRWSLRACRHGTLGRLHCGCRRSRLRALLCPFWVEPRLSLRWFSWGPVPWGPTDVWGPGLFRACFMPCGWGCCSPHTLLNVYMEEPYEHKRAHTHRCTLKHSHWCKTGAHRHPLSWSAVASNLFCNISYVCCSIIFNI